MCVNPGRGSQPFIASSRDKIRNLRRRIDERRLTALIEVDGGVNPDNISGLAADGARVFVAGNAVFGAPDPAAAVRRMKDLAEKGGRA
jgi:ribulose-phosphate 3-epimerase